MAPLSRKALQSAADTLDKIARDKHAWRDAWRVEEDKAPTTEEAGRLSHITEGLQREATLAETIQKNLRPRPLNEPEVFRPEKNKKR
ncbi:hypothetical protein HZB58_02800 [Candidatus Gottesmanbacteria bacterium]|nr:hypothetical protein [Candidatus Gottesmanbacteria bacterium]